MKNRIFVIRHLSRNKLDRSDPQTPTLMGMIEAFVMGLIIARDFGAKFVQAVSSPQPRAIRTARVILRAFLPLDQGDSPIGDPMLMVKVSEGLDDFSSDPRFAPLKDDLKRTKGRTDVESEQAIFLAGGALEELRFTKLEEATRVIDQIDQHGDTLVTLHGATVDGLYAHYVHQSTDGMKAFGRMIGKCEGFVLSYDPDTRRLLQVEKIERPLWLNALAALIGAHDD